MPVQVFLSDSLIKIDDATLALEAATFRNKDVVQIRFDHGRYTLIYHALMVPLSEAEAIKLNAQLGVTVINNHASVVLHSVWHIIGCWHG